MDWLTWAAFPLGIIGLWLYTAYMSHTFPTLTGKRIVLLIAHPDDEAMFFAPTVLALTKPELQNDFRILCLSTGKNVTTRPFSQELTAITGNADGLGDVRKTELVKSALHLGVRSEAHVEVI